MSKATQKFKTSINLSSDLEKWVDEKVEARIFANRSHAMEFALEYLRNNFASIYSPTASSPINDLSLAVFPQTKRRTPRKPLEKSQQ